MKYQSKYTVNGSRAFDSMLESHCADIAEAVKTCPFNRDIAALVLGGGYGRGEGGVFKMVSGKEKPYNDLDFFVIAENVNYFRRREINRFFRDFGKNCSWELGADVDFCPVKTIRQLRKLPPTLMWQELRLGYRLIYGREEALRALPVCDLNELPPAESLRLLLNRGTGLLLARERLAKKELLIDDRDFVGRNLFKAVLACGDVFLLHKKQYSISVLERLKTVEKTADMELAEFYRRAVAFKCRPRIYSFEELQILFRQVSGLFEKSCFSFLSICCGCAVGNSGELDAALERNDPFTAGESLKTRVKYLIQNLLYMRRLGCGSVFSSSNPRTGLLRCLLALLFEHCVEDDYIITVGRQAFLKGWKKFN
ncbi:MAG: hypothetical protein PHV59_12850 [Victivallales bacterium]|nr:hypothetical protein [Victivallales bacterium]